jgi:hypothetical protein
LGSVKGRVLTQPSGEDPVDVPPRGLLVDLENLLKDIDNFIGPVPTGNDSDSRDASSWDEKSPASPSQASLAFPQEKKQGRASRAWDKFKKPLTKKFGS